MSLDFLLVSIGLILGAPSAGQVVLTGQVVAQATPKREEAIRQKASGDGLLKNGKRKQALDAYKKAAEIDPSWYEPHEAIGNMLFSTKQYVGAVDAFKKAISVEPRYATGYYNIAFAYRKARRYKEAAEYYKKYIERKPDDPDAYYGLAATFEALGKIQKAVDNYLLYAAKEKRPSERQYIVKARNKAQALSKSLGQPLTAPKPATTTAPVTATASRPASRPPASGEPVSKPAASAVTASAAKPAPTEKPAVAVVAPPKPAPKPAPKPNKDREVTDLLAKGDAAMGSKSYTLAMQSYFKAVKLAPRNAEALYRLGLVYDATGNTKAALLKWKDALSINPQHTGASEAIARAESKASKPVPSKPVASRPAGRPSLKSPAASTAVAAPSAAPVAKARSAGASTSQRVAKLLSQGDAFFRKKSFSKAIAAYTHATQLDERNEEALFKLGMAYALSGNYKVAVFKWKKVLEINPHNASALRNIERAKTKFGGTTTPPKAATVPVRQPKPTGYEAYMARARQLKRKGDAQGVLEAASKALKVKKDDAHALLLRGEALVILRRYAEAKRAFSAAMIADASLSAPLYGLGEASRLAGDKDRAKYYFKMYLQSKAKDISQAKLKKVKAFLSQ
jgi:tetratricopeptide (TPR) repeat protein